MLIPILHISVGVPRCDNGIKTAVWLTGLVESISATEGLKLGKERGHFRINEMPRPPHRVVWRIKGDCAGKGFKRAVGTQYHHRRCYYSLFSRSIACICHSLESSSRLQANGAVLMYARVLGESRSHFPFYLSLSTCFLKLLPLSRPLVSPLPSSPCLSFLPPPQLLC